MKTKCFIFALLFLLSNCSSKIEANIPRPVAVKQEEKLSIDVFSLTFHKQLGSCTSLPITHRMLVFSYIPLTPSGDDHYAGTMEILLDDQAGTYEALYREFPGTANVDQTPFQTTLNGTFEVVKAITPTANDKMFLQNLGVVTPAIKGNKVNFFITLNGDINRVVTQNEVLGSVYFKSTSLITDNCLF